MKTRKIVTGRGRFLEFKAGDVQRVVRILRKEYRLWALGGGEKSDSWRK